VSQSLRNSVKGEDDCAGRWQVLKELDLEEARASGVTEGETKEELEHRGKLFSK